MENNPSDLSQETIRALFEQQIMRLSKESYEKSFDIQFTIGIPQVN
jgi:hypothetical protein